MEGLAKRNDLDTVQKSVVTVSHLIRAVEFHQANYRQLHDRHLTTVKTTNQRVRVWSLIECVLILIIGLVQVMIIKRTLSKPRGHHSLMV